MIRRIPSGNASVPTALTLYTHTPGTRSLHQRGVLLILFLAALALGALAQNAIVTENALPGNPASEWDISGAGDLRIQGFATDLSVDQGGTVGFKIDVKDAASHTIRIYRLGYYGGAGARLIADLGTFAGVAQPDPVFDPVTGLVDCGNWSETASWQVPEDAVSGIYIARLTRIGDQGASHIAFIVRDDDGHADLLFKTSDGTWQAYNGYGGNSFYTGSMGYPNGRAPKVSYNRPFYTRGGGGGSSGSEDWLFNAEYPMIRFLERNGYDVSYTTDLDMDRMTGPITPADHRVLLSVGHDEYWSAAERARWEAARDAGVHLAFFSGNEVYWKTRWENSIDGSDTPHRTLVCYKEGTSGENQCGTKCDPLPDMWTGLWRDGCDHPEADGCLPENALSGQISWVGTTLQIQVPAQYKDLRFWRNTSVATLGSGQTRTLTAGSLGYEWDAEHPGYAAHYPPGRILMSSTTQNGKTHKLSMYRHASGVLVFGAGTVQWTWGLDAQHDNPGSPVDPDIQQATVNVLADMGVQPATLQSGLIAATASTDNDAPTSVITSPVHEDTFANSSSITISGTASDAGGGVVAGVEVSVDGGTTWMVASGSAAWSYTWVPTAEDGYTVLSRAFDDSGNMEAAGTAPAANAITVTISGSLPCPCTVFNAGDAPAIPRENDGQPIEVGMKFRAAEDGFITAVRFYKGEGTTGTHTGHLWSASGTLLATAPFTSETASGWQEAALDAPLAVTAGTTYIVSQHSLSGDYPVTDPFFTSARINGPLRGLANGEDGANGVYLYTAVPAFPTQDYQASNYWVDVVFGTNVGPDESAPVLVSRSPAPGATGIAIGTNVTATFNEAIDQATLTGSTFMLKDADDAPVAAAVTYDAGTRTATLDPDAALSYATTYTATVIGGASGITDVAGNALEADVVWSFATGEEPPPPPPPPTDGPGGPVLVIGATSNPFSRYTAEILRAEGFNAFTAMDITQVDAAVLDAHDVVVLGEIPLSAGQVALLSTWVDAGGTLIAFRPEGGNTALHTLLGIAPAGGGTSDGYLLVHTATEAGAGIVGETMQFHGTADHYTLTDATSLATLYANASTATAYPAVTQRSVGDNGGTASAFLYDLARSVVYTRQGNPAWAGQERDGQSGPIRANDMFFGAAAGDPQPDWIDLDKVAIPQADEQQHLLSNIITLGSLHRKPMPRFWFLPDGHKAAVVMTGDDHGNGGTVARFNHYQSLSADNSAQAVADWKAIRGSSYVFPGTPISDAQAAAFQAAGFEIGLHLNTGCADYTPASYQSDLATQLAQLDNAMPSLLPTTTHRTHCIAWSDWASQASIQAANGIRLDVNYYYWPASWVQDRPGMFTGSGLPMRFAELDGTLIDCYQVATQMTDESGITYGTFCDALLDKALGPQGYYGVFCANMHTDAGSSAGSEAIIASAMARDVPVISARQLLTWLDGRNASTFADMDWSDGTLTFTATVGSGATNLRGMLPMEGANGVLMALSNGSPVAFTVETIKGIDFAFFPVTNGTYTASYAPDELPATITDVVAEPGPDGRSVTVTWETDEPSDSEVLLGTDPGSLSTAASDASLVTAHTMHLTGLTPGTTYHYRVRSEDGSENVSLFPAPPAAPLEFSTPMACFVDGAPADFAQGTFIDTYRSLAGEGVSLRPQLVTEFDVLPGIEEWLSAPWTEGTSTVSAGILHVDGARYNTAAAIAFGPGSSMEFVATFGAASFQHAGFGGGTDAIGSGGIYNGESPWAMFSTHNTTNTVRARTYDGSETADVTFTGSASLIGTPHLYKIVWNASTVDFHVDGELVHSQAVAIAGTMRPAISDFNNGGAVLSVDWVTATPHATPGTFDSRVFDSGAVTSWNTITWNDTIPAGTALDMAVRSGDTPVPDGTWSAFLPVTKGGNVDQDARYVQYRATLSTTVPTLTPVLSMVSIECGEAPEAGPVVTIQPAAQEVCEGEDVELIAAATGNPLPVVHWEVSMDGAVTWDTIPGAVNDTLVFVAAAADSGHRYRAVFDNGIGPAAATDTVELVVHALPSVTLSTAEALICPGGSIELELDALAGTGPFDLVVNSAPYASIEAGVPFAVSPAEISLWPNTATPVSPSVTDNLPIEVGVKFVSEVDGWVTGVRFYKGALNTGTHTGNLWTTGGELLATAVFTGESADGWQEVRFAAPMAIAANTTHIVSYYSPGGYFAIDGGGLVGVVSNGPLSTIANSAPGGPNGVYAYGGGFPASGDGANYWVDVLFSENPSATEFELTSVTDANGCVAVGAPLDIAEVNYMAAPTGTLAFANDGSCEGGSVDLVFHADPGSSGPFDLVINGVVAGDVVDGVPFTWEGRAASRIWNATTPGVTTLDDNDRIVLGVKFRSAEAGDIDAIRFYKSWSEAGTLDYVVRLWTDGTQGSPGSILAEATVSLGDDQMGWQEVAFDDPVAIEANTTYIASFLTPGGNYAVTGNYFGSAYNEEGSPLTALSTADGPNGVFAYEGSTPGFPFPSATFNAANYWVDVVFSASGEGIVLTAISSSACPEVATVLENGQVLDLAPTYYSRASGGMADEIWSTSPTGVARNVTWTPCASLVVQNGHAVTIASDVDLRDVLTEEGSTLAIGSGAILSVHGGTAQFSGTLAADDHSTIALMGGDTPMELIVADPTSMHNLMVIAAGGVTVHGDLRIRGTLQLHSGVFDATAAQVTLRSTASATARLGPVAATASYVGDLNMERYIPGGATNWRFLGSPIGGRTVADWQDDFITAGYPGSHYPTFSDPPGSGILWPSVRWYDETNTGPDQSAGLLGVASSAQELSRGQGFAVWCGDALGGTAPFVVDVRNGPPHIANPPVQLPMTWTDTENPLVDGWNLMSNPLPSAIAFDQLERGAHVEDYVTFYDPANGNTSVYDLSLGYGTNGATNTIQSSQGFFLKAFGPESAVTVAEDAKVNDNNGGFFGASMQSVVPAIRIRISSAINTYRDETVVVFHEGTPARENDDVLKYVLAHPAAPQVATLAPDGTQFAINAYGDVDPAFSVPVSVKAAVNGTYILTLTEVGDPGFDCLVLEDLQTGTITPVDGEATYSFTISTDDDHTVARFLLRSNAPVADFSAPAFIAANTPLAFVNTSTGGSSFTWDLGDGTFSNEEAPVHAWVSEGTYTVTLTVTNGTCAHTATRSVVISSAALPLAVKVFLQGPYDPSTRLMRDDLRAAGRIPLEEPYADMGYVHQGGGGEATWPAVLATTGEDAIVDWVLLELHDAVTPSLVVASRSALLQRDGDVTGVDGTSPVHFALPVGEYHVVVRHRNHLGVMSRSAISLSPDAGSVDFADGSVPASGTDPQLVLADTHLLWAGDVNFDGVVKYTGQQNDRDPILSAIGGVVPTATLAGYHAADVNLDGTVKYTGQQNDRDIILLNIGGVVPTNSRQQQVP